jgi:CHASE3 domain sensor protein
LISLRTTLATVDTTRRRAIGQILLLAAGFLVLVAISASSVILVNQSRKDNGWVVHTVEVENQMDTLLLQVRRAESATRGFLLTSEPRFRTEYEMASAAAIADADKLRTLSHDNPAQVENIKRLQQPLDARLEEFAKIIDFVNRQPAASR